VAIGIFASNERTVTANGISITSTCIWSSLSRVRSRWSKIAGRNKQLGEFNITTNGIDADALHAFDANIESAPRLAGGVASQQLGSRRREHPIGGRFRSTNNCSASDLGTLIQADIISQLTALDNGNPILPVAPVAEG
jgi:hypothetical protein